MKLHSYQVVEALAHEAPCLGALFASYSFEPAFFEEQLLHTLLRLRSDPIEQTPRFLEEARAALQAVPVAVIVDGTVRQSGRRLPYELREVRGTTFHPKVALVLYPEFARLRVGSGNLTRAGHGGNTELFFQRDLAYDVPEDAGLLQQVAEFFDGAGKLTGRIPEGVVSPLEQVLEEIERRLRGVAAVAPLDVAFLTSFKSPILPRFRELVPNGWAVERAALLAPFHENDDAQAAGSEELFSVALELAGAAPEVDIGVCWNDAPITAAESLTAPGLEDCVGHVCGWTTEDAEGNAMVDYLILTELTEKRAAGLDRHGNSRRWARSALEHSFENGRLFPVPTVDAHGPAGAVQVLTRKGKSVRVALHPGVRLEEGRPHRRILHGKLLLLTARRGERYRTWALVGSANASRQALLRDVEAGGNVEATVAFQFESDLRLWDFAPELVVVPQKLVALSPRSFPEPDVNYGVWIRAALYRVRSRQLVVMWAETGPAGLSDWTLTYRDHVLERGGAVPAGREVSYDDFRLETDDAELVLRVGEVLHSIPIVIDDVAALPANPLLSNPTLEELLALLGGRLSTERLAALKSSGSPVGSDAVLESIFGDGVGTADVFRAWWALAADLAAADSSLCAFRAVLEGPLGARAVWTKLAEALDSGTMSAVEVWFYGCELHRTLLEVELPPLNDQVDRRALLDSFCSELRSELKRHAPTSTERRWLAPVVRFYEGGTP